MTLLVALAMASGGGSVKAASPEGVSRIGGVVSTGGVGGVGGGRVNSNQAALSDTLLDEVGHLNRTVTPVESAAWINELRHMPIAVLSARRAAWLHLRVGEWELAKNEEPIKAAWHFDVARKRVSPSDPLYGQAVYNKGVARFWNCDYQASIATFRFLINHKKSQASSGFIPSRASLWLSHASACAGYHAEHGALGIPEPPRLDPHCAAAGLAMCFKRLGLPSDKKSVLPHIRVTGRGSNAGDVRTACRNLTALSQADPTGQVGKAFGSGVRARILVVNEAALRVLPLPALAFVEHDHYVAVLAADKGGVTYSCSDCGAWPGGLVRLSWKQWRRMDMGAVIPIVKKGSAEDEALAILLGEKAGAKPLLRRTGTRAQKASAVRQAVAERFGVRVASAKPVVSAVGSDTGFVPRVTALVQRMTGTRAATSATPPVSDSGGGGDTDIAIDGSKEYATSDGKDRSLNCGGDLYSLRCTFPTICPIWDCTVGCAGSSAHDPVNLATLEEEYTPEPDLTVYNPSGPSIRWSRVYNSMRTPEDWYNIHGGGGYPAHYALSGLGEAWSHSYNIQMIPRDSDGTYPTSLLLQNGARVPLTLPAGGATVAGAAVIIPAGLPFKVTWNLDAVTGGRFFLITWKDASKWRIGPDGVEEICDAFGRSIFFDRSLGSELRIRRDSPTGQILFTAYYGGAGITAVRDNVGGRDSSGNVCGRTVYYNYTYKVETNTPGTTTDDIGFNTLTEVSHVVLTPSTGATSAAASSGNTGWRYRYDYGGVTMGNNLRIPTLYKFQTPSPDGALNAVSTSTLSYAIDGTMYVLAHTDANSNVTEFSHVDHTHTLVKRAGLFYFVVGYDNLMSKTSQTDNSYDSANPTAAKLIFQASYGSSDYYPSSVSDGTGITTNFTYDTFGNVVTRTEPRHSSVGSGPGITTTYTYDYVGFPLGRVTNVSDGNLSRDVNVEYVTGGGVSPRGVKKVTYPSPTGGSTPEEVQFTYDYLGNVLSVVTPGNAANSIRTTTFNYTSDLNIDSTTYTTPGGAPRRGQPLSVSVSSGALSQTVSHLRYDDRGNVIASWGPRRDVTQGFYGLTETVYNVADQPVYSYLPARSASAPLTRGYSEMTYLYDGGPVKTVKFYDETGAMIRQASPKFGKEGEALGGQTPSTSNIATQSLDAVYRPVSITDGGGHTTNYDYYTSGPDKSRPKAVRLPGNAYGTLPDSVQFTEYDDAGRLTKRVDGNNIEATLFYNVGGDGALAAVSYADLSTTPATSLPAEYVSYVYDAYGRLTTRTDNSGVEALAYNDAGMVTGVTTTYTGLPGKTLGYTYNQDGSRAMMTMPNVLGLSGGSFDYTYDELGRPDLLVNPYAHRTGWTYWDDNSLKTQGVANQTTGVNIYTANYEANGLGQLSSLIHRQGSVYAPGAVLSQYDNTLYDGAGNLTQVVRQITGAQISPYADTMAYQYNAKDEMTEERYTNSNYATNYAFDNAGNATTYQGGSRTHNANNQLTGPGAYVYDGNGNPTTYYGTGMAFDARDNLTYIAGRAFSAGYTSEGVRAWKEIGTGQNAQRTYFIYDGMTPVIEMDTLGNVKAVNTFGQAGLISRHNVAANGPSTSVDTFYTFDEAGSVNERFDGSGNALSVHAFQAVGYGTSNVPGGVNPDPWGYKAQAGYYTDQETGLILCGFRYYDYQQGRWLNRDPIGYAGGLNLYAYCGGNPVMGVDRLGLQDDEEGFGEGVVPDDWSETREGLAGLGKILTGRGAEVIGEEGESCSALDSASEKMQTDFEVQSIEKASAMVGGRTLRDLFRFGRPRGPLEPRVGNDINPVGDTVYPTDPIEGPSLFTDPEHPDVHMNGPYFRLPAGSLIPEGYGIIADGSDVPGGTEPFGHHTFFNTRPVETSEYEKKFLGMNFDKIKFGDRPRNR